MDDFYLVVPTLEFAAHVPAEEFRAEGPEEPAYVGAQPLVNADELVETTPAAGLTICASVEREPDQGWRNLPNTRIRGTWAEIRFALDGMEHDLIVGKPYTDESFDCFAMPREQKVAAGKRKRMKIFTVQVRSSNSPHYRYKQELYYIGLQHGYDKAPYKGGDFDYLAAYVPKYKAWYIIPMKEIEGLYGLDLRTADPETTSKWEKFRERWDLLGGKNWDDER